MKRRIRILQKIFLVAVIVFSSLFVFACEKTSTNNLTLDNYNKYLEITSGTGGGAGGWNFWIPHCYVHIKKVSDASSFQNVTITYKFKLYDAEHTINLEKEYTSSLEDLKNDFSNSFQLQFDHTNGNRPPQLYTTVEVLKINGTGTLISRENLTKYIGFGFLIVLALGLLVFVIARAGVFSNKFNKITSGMTYQEAINILGEPDESNSAKGVTTCIWKDIMYSRNKTYVLTFKDGVVLLDIEHHSWY